MRVIGITRGVKVFFICTYIENAIPIINEYEYIRVEHNNADGSFVALNIGKNVEALVELTVVNFLYNPVHRFVLKILRIHKTPIRYSNILDILPLIIIKSVVML